MRPDELSRMETDIHHRSSTKRRKLNTDVLSKPTSLLDPKPSSADMETHKSNDPELSDDDDAASDDLYSSSTESFSKSKRKSVLSVDRVSESRQAIAKSGVVYLSRIPPRMSPTKLRQLLSAFESPVLRIFLAPESTGALTRRVKSGGSKKRQFIEGWVEFQDKKVAKKVAELLNARQIGGKKGGFWYDDIWCIKYLPKFKWHHLTEQIGNIISSVDVLTAQLIKMLRGRKNYVTRSHKRNVKTKHLWKMLNATK